MTTAVLLGGGATSATALPEPPADLHALEHHEAEAGFGSHDGVLERGCQHHGYRYRVDAEDSQWSLELFLIDRTGEQVATGYEWKGNDRARGRGRFEFCSQATRPGRFTIKARLTWQDGAYHEKWLEPKRIRLRRG